MNAQYKKHGIILSIIIVCICICSISIFYFDTKKSKETIQKPKEKILLYVLADNMLVEYESITYATTTEKKIEEIINYLMQDQSDFTSLLKKDTQLNEVKINGDSAELYFDVLNYDVKQERKLLESLIYSCTQFDQVNNIKLYINNEVLDQMPKGHLSLLNTKRSFGMNAIEANQLYLHEGNSSLIYYVKDINHKTYYVPRSVRFSLENDYKEVLDILLKVPSSTLHLKQPLCEKQIVSLKEPKYEDGILHLYLNKNILVNRVELDDGCAKMLTKVFEQEESIQMIKIHVEENTFDINLAKMIKRKR